MSSGAGGVDVSRGIGVDLGIGGTSTIGVSGMIKKFDIPTKKVPKVALVVNKDTVLYDNNVIYCSDSFVFYVFQVLFRIKTVYKVKP